MLGWCSPQSSVPRQTVGHHARAAKYEMGQTAACEGYRGVVPRRASTSTPQGSFFPSPSHTHRPGCSGPHGPAGCGVDFPVPQNSFVWALQKMGSRARARSREAPQGPPALRQREPAHVDWARPSLLVSCPPPLRIPTGLGAVGCAGRRAVGWISHLRKAHLGALCIQMGSRAPTRAGRPGGRPHDAGRQPQPPLPLRRRASRPAYPAPPSPSLPPGLPCTALTKSAAESPARPTLHLPLPLPLPLRRRVSRPAYAI